MVGPRRRSRPDVHCAAAAELGAGGGLTSIWVEAKDPRYATRRTGAQGRACRPRVAARIQRAWLG